MTTLNVHAGPPEAVVDDDDAVRTVVQLCLDGEATLLSLCCIDGTWKIVNKTFAHLGGDPPA